MNLPVNNEDLKIDFSLSAKPRVYKIRTLADLWRMDTIEQMERAINEIGAAMLRMRQLQDEVLAGASRDLHGEAKEHLLEFPDVFEWVDDGLGSIAVDVVDQGGHKTRMIEDVIPQA